MKPIASSNTANADTLAALTEDVASLKTEMAAAKIERAQLSDKQERMQATLDAILSRLDDLQFPQMHQQNPPPQPHRFKENDALNDDVSVAVEFEKEEELKPQPTAIDEVEVPLTEGQANHTPSTHQKGQVTVSSASMTIGLDNHLHKDVTHNDSRGEVSSSYSLPSQVKPPLLPSTSNISFANTGVVQKPVIVATPVVWNPDINTSITTPASSRDPRLRYAGLDVGNLDVQQQRQRMTDAQKVLDEMLKLKAVLFLLHGLNTDSGSYSKPTKFEGIVKFEKDLSTLHPILTECRVWKTSMELSVIQFANDISSEAHIEVMRNIKLGRKEYQLESMFLHHTYVYGGCRHCSYTCICATGDNRAKLLDVHWTMDKRTKWKLLDGFVEIPSLTQDDLEDPLGLPAPSTEEMVIVMGIAKGGVMYGFRGGTADITAQEVAGDVRMTDESLKSYKVWIDVEENLISVYNNGDGVPVEIYVPEMISGHLLTSSNYDGIEKKTTGGRNGYDAKLANIFSTEFVIETADGIRQKKCRQVFGNNMGIKSEPEISKCKSSENWTKVSFKPDLAKFGMTYLEKELVASNDRLGEEWQLPTIQCDGVQPFVSEVEAIKKAFQNKEATTTDTTKQLEMMKQSVTEAKDNINSAYSLRVSPSSRMSSLFLGLNLRRLCTAATTEAPEAASISSLGALAKLRTEHDPGKVLKIYSSVSDHNSSHLFRRYAQDLAIKRLAVSHRFSDIESLIESRKSEPQIIEEASLPTLIRSYGVAGMFDHALKTYDQIEALESRRSSIPFNAPSAAATQCKLYERVPKLFGELPAKYGEVYVQLQESVRSCDVYLVQPTCPPANKNLMELLVMIDGRASAKTITAVIPYFGYARTDRKTQGRKSIAAKLVANLIMEAGAHRVLALDLHSGQSMGYFDIPVDHVYGQPVILDFASKEARYQDLEKRVSTENMAVGISSGDHTACSSEVTINMHSAKDEIAKLWEELQVTKDHIMQYNEVNEQNKILHSRLEALHIKLAERGHNYSKASAENSSHDTSDDSGMQGAVNYHRRSKEMAETEMTLLRESNMRLREENKHNFEKYQKLREADQQNTTEVEHLQSKSDNGQEVASDNDATWEDVKTFQERFPDFNLEVEVGFDEGGNDRKQEWNRAKEQHKAQTGVQEGNKRVGARTRKRSTIPGADLPHLIEPPRTLVTPGQSRRSQRNPIITQVA